jgi:hypothetical protein
MKGRALPNKDSDLPNPVYSSQKYKADRDIWDAELEYQRKLEEEHSEFRNTMLMKNRTLQAINNKKTEDLIVNWKKTQQVKKARNVRDLQFELTMTRIDELKGLRDKQIHEKKGKEGVNEFERTLKKLGIGNSEANDIGLSVSYETPEAYEERMKILAEQNMPTLEEVNNFKTQLKERTTANRLARYEKARRRRRALVDQGNGKDEES